MGHSGKHEPGEGLPDHQVAAAVVKPIKAVSEAVEETAHLLQTSGELKTGVGLASGALAFTLGVLCLLGV
ncbi:MAG: hypothetical protein RI907_1496, partial [Pseudomonadota bacterium]